METVKKEPGSSDIIRVWVDRYGDKMFTWALQKTNDRETAADLVQDTFLVASQSLEKFESRCEPGTWLYSILNRRIALHFRVLDRRKGQPGPLQDEQGNLLDDKGFIQVLNACMNELPEKWSATLRLKYLHSRNSHRICHELDISPSNFWQILHRAKLRVRECLENHWFKG